MKRIISILLIAAMMPACGKMQQLSQPVETKTVEVPAKFSWKSEFTGIRAAEKVIALAAVAGMSYFAYQRGITKGLSFSKDMLKSKATDITILQQTLDATRYQLENTRTMLHQLEVNNRTLQAKVDKVEVAQ